MADAIVSVVAEQLLDIVLQQIRNEVNLARGVDKEALNLSDGLKEIRSVLDDVEMGRFEDESVKDWLKKLEITAREMDDVLGEWNYAVLKHKMEDHQSTDPASAASTKQKVRSFIQSSCLCFKKAAGRRNIASKMQNVKEKLDEILKEKDRYNFVINKRTTNPSEYRRVQTPPLVDVSKVYGREDDKNTLVTELMADGGSIQEGLDIPVVSIVGGVGLGKTTLAQLVYNDARVAAYFELRIWVYVSNHFDKVEIAWRVVDGVQGQSRTSGPFEIVPQHLENSVQGKKFLLVLDDVWNHESSRWEPLKASLGCGGAGSKILVTTRNRGVAISMGSIESQICCPNELSKKDCWLVMRHSALIGRNEEEFEKLQDVGMKIADKCHGLPLVAKVLGSVLSFKNVDEWEKILNSELWQLEEARVEVFPHLFLSYNELSPAYKRCFSYCAIFPKDSIINVEELIEYWMALGYLGHDVEDFGGMELRGQECFNHLAMYSLFQDNVLGDGKAAIKACRMNGIVHDFAKSLMKNDRLMEVADSKKKSCQHCDPLLISNVREYCSLFCSQNDVPPKHFDCLTSLRVLRVDAPLWNLPRGIRNLIHLRWLAFSNIMLSAEDTKTICELYNLQTLSLCNCNVRVIPWEIGNLIHLRHLNLLGNTFIRELPESLCGLRELRTLNIQGCDLHELPLGILSLTKLKHLHCTTWLKPIPQLDQLTGLLTLGNFHGGNGLKELRLLKNLNQLISLGLCITFDDELVNNVENAREADLRGKQHLRTLEIRFHNKTRYEKKLEEPVWMKLTDALEPHPSLQQLILWCYRGSELGGWTTSPLNGLRFIKLNCCKDAVPLGKLPLLEEIVVYHMLGMQVVGRQFLDVDRSSSSSVEAAASANSTIVAFPKLKKLTFNHCEEWVEWEDVTAEEEESAAVSLMPCLTELTIWSCKALRALPHRLLRKAAALQMLEISYSTQLEKCYCHEDSSAWKSISRNNPSLQLKTRF